MISNCGHDENGRYSGGKAGDQTGTEWQVINWYSRPWKCVLRHPNAETLKEMTTVNDDVSKLATGDNEQGTPQENAEDDENASNEDKATNPPTEQENGENWANTEPDKATEEQQEDKVIIPQGKMRVTVICDGSLNIRRSAAWGNDNICGRAIRGQSYYVKEIHVVDGKKMVRTIGDLYLSGESEHVQFEQL